MGKFINSFIVEHSKGLIVALVSAIVIGAIATITIIQSGLDENIAILEAGSSDIPIIKNDDLQELGRLYSELNDKFEREIDELVTGKANRNNKANQPLNHYGVYGKDNANPFKNADYVNGANIKYEKIDASIKDGASNFNDIIAVMAVLYDQKMDLADTMEMKEVFTDLFWLSHTFTFDSTELYPCRHGCVSDTYKCTDVYTDYGSTRYLKYDPFTVRKHSEYEGYEPDEDFRLVYPEGECVVHGKTGAGCIWDESKVCYHGGGNETFESCNKTFVVDDSTTVIYGEVGDEVVPESIDSIYLVSDPSSGHKIAKTDTKCYYYKNIKLCNERLTLAGEIKTAKATLKSAEDTEQSHSESCDYDGDDECPTCKSNTERVERASEKVSELEEALQSHISDVCEKDEITSKYWCDGYKLCMGHITHYRCPGHKIVLCLGHTSLNLTIKVLYRDELLDEAFKVFR